MPNNEPQTIPSQEPIRFTLRLDPELHRTLSDIAQREYRSLADQIRYILDEYCRQHPLPDDG